MNRRITLVDIAEATGYSVNSVSRALMDASDISVKTKEHIRKVADELGYIPNRAAASLKKGNSKIIGVIYDNLLNPYYNSICNYLEDNLSKLGYVILYSRTSEFDLNAYSNMLSRNLEGIISFLVPTVEVEQRIKNQKFPTVIIGRKAESISSVYADDKLIGCLAAKTLIEQNCKNVFYIGEVKSTGISVLRAEGFKEEILKYGLNCEVRYREENGAFEEIIESMLNNKDLDGVFCFSDYLAFKVIKYLRKYKREDIVIVGVDNIKNEIEIPIDFVSIGQNKSKTVNDVLKLLFSQINDSNFKTQFIEEKVFVVKES